MDYCPKNAEAFGAKPTNDEHAAAWCRRQYQPRAERCQRCELRKRLGVGEPAQKAKKAVVDPVQGRLF